MTGNNLVEALRKIDFLEGFAEEHLEKMASVGEMVEFEEGIEVFRQGQPANEVYLLTSGSVSLEICAPGVGCRRILTVSQGELLGWSPVLQQPRLTATARTLTPIQAIKISSSQILTLCEHNPRFGFEFMGRVALALSKRVKAARLQLLDVYGAESANSK